MNQKIIELEDVSFSYGKQLILNNVSISIFKKDFFGIIGPNGGGKTTLLKIMLGSLVPDSGKVRIFGKSIINSKILKDIGYVSQKATNFDNNFPATVFEIVSMGRFAKRGLLKNLVKEDYTIIENALKDVDMLSLKNNRIGDLSGGQQQRAFIARALASEPKMLILDEPLIGVDMESQHKFYELLNYLNKEKDLTIILVSHDIGMISKSFTKIACVNLNVKVHNVSKGIDNADLICSYPPGFKIFPHHHD